MIGKKLSPILNEISLALLEYDTKEVGKYGFADNDLISATKIFASVVFDKMFELQMKEKISLENSSAMATKLGNEIRHLIKVYTNIDMHELSRR